MQHAQNWAAPFNEDVTAAKGRHQQAIAEAHDAFKQACAAAQEQRNADYRAARDWFDSLKSAPQDPAYNEARNAFQRSKSPASLAAARKALAEAIHKADDDYKAALVRAGRKHSVTVH